MIPFSGAPTLVALTFWQSVFSEAQALIKDNIYGETIFKDAKRYKSLGWFVELTLSQPRTEWYCNTQTSTTKGLDHIYADMKWKPDWWGCAAPGTPPSPVNAQWGKVKQVLLEVNTLSPSIWGDTKELMEFLPRSLSFRSCGQWPAHTWGTGKMMWRYLTRIVHRHHLHHYHQQGKEDVTLPDKKHGDHYYNHLLLHHHQQGEEGRRLPCRAGEGSWWQQPGTRQPQTAVRVTWVQNTKYKVKNTGCFFHWYPPQKLNFNLKYGKPRLGESTLT